MNYKVVLSKVAEKQKPLLKSAHLDDKARKLLDILLVDPFLNPPPYEKLVGVSATYSRRINYQHRLVYRVDQDAKVVHVLSMWTHYEY